MHERFEDFTLYISHAFYSMQKIKAAGMTAHDLKSSHAVCIHYLSRYPEGLTLKDLTNLCGEDKSIVSRSLNSLISRGYVEKESPESPKKYNLLHRLTEKGWDVAMDVSQRITSAVNYGGRDLTSEERRIFYQSLKSISDNLEEYLDIIEHQTEEKV